MVSETNTVRSWSREGRKPLSPTWSLTPEQKDDAERLGAARANFGNQRPVVIDAEFGITRATIDDDDIPSERVAAAMSFLHSRYDLSIDIWDIAGDPGLATLVAKEEADHVVGPGERLQRVPKQFMERANQLEDVRRDVEAELANFPLGEWWLASKATLSWRLMDPELPVEWTLRIDTNSVSVAASATDGRVLPLEVTAGGGWHHGLGWKVGTQREGHPRLSAFLEEYLAKVRPVVRGAMREPAI